MCRQMFIILESEISVNVPFSLRFKKKDAVCKTEIKPWGVNWSDAVSSSQGKPNTLNGVREALLIRKIKLGKLKVELIS